MHMNQEKNMLVKLFEEMHWGSGCVLCCAKVYVQFLCEMVGCMWSVWVWRQGDRYEVHLEQESSWWTRRNSFSLAHSYYPQKQGTRLGPTSQV